MNLPIFLWPWPTSLQGAAGKGSCVSSPCNTGRKCLSHGKASAKACTFLDSELRERDPEATGLETFRLKKQIVSGAEEDGLLRQRAFHQLMKTKPRSSMPVQKSRPFLGQSDALNLISCDAHRYDHYFDSCTAPSTIGPTTRNIRSNKKAFTGLLSVPGHFLLRSWFWP